MVTAEVQMTAIPFSVDRVIETALAHTTAIVTADLDKAVTERKEVDLDLYKSISILFK